MNNGVNNSTTTTPIVPVQTQTTAQQVQQPTQVQPQAQTVAPTTATANTNTEQVAKKPKKKLNFTPFLIIIILGLIGYIVYSSKSHNSEIEKIKYECSPIKAGEEVKLDLNSTLVTDLYNKIKTNIREDLSLMELNDTMKLYLAYRQIPPDKFYDSNCNLFDDSAMEPYTCQETSLFMPRAFKEETLQLEVKKLFGEKTVIPNANVQIGKNCMGGYEYIEKRGEYVEGFCSEHFTTTFKAEKKLVEAISTGNAITLKEDVKYIGNESTTVPEYLKSGTYVHTFKLDTNYNYVYVSKEYQEKY